MTLPTQLDIMLDGYIECALWSSTTERDSCEEPGSETVPMDAHYDREDIAPESLATMREDCAAFLEGNALYIELADMTPARVGHDFWLTRNHHGAGFWDRGLGDVGDALTDAAQAYGESYLYVGDDGKVHSE